MRKNFFDHKFFRRLADQPLIVIHIRGRKNVLRQRRIQKKTSALGGGFGSSSSGHRESSLANRRNVNSVHVITASSRIAILALRLAESNPPQVTLAPRSVAPKPTTQLSMTAEQAPQQERQHQQT